MTAFDENRLYRNDRGRRFTDVSEAAGVADARWSTGCSFADFDAAGDLDLFVAAAVDPTRQPS